MKKALKILILLFPVIMMTTGCDFFRHLAGRPDSEEIDAKAESIRMEQEEAQRHKKALEDSIAAVKKHYADSVAAMDSLAAEHVLRQPKTFGGLKSDASFRYYIVVGAFSSSANAEKYCAKISDKGFNAECLPFRNGFTGVGVSGTDDVVEIYKSLKEIRRQDFCPKEAWILDNVKL